MSTNRQKRLLHYAITPVLLLCPLIAQAKLNVVATLPDFGSLAREIGKDKIDLVVLGKPSEDPHFVDPRPNFVASLRNADVLIESGAGLELGWLAPLLEKARNPKLDIGKPGRVRASYGIRLMNIPTNVMRAAGEEHLSGNPHFTVDPLIAKAVAQRIAKSFGAVRRTRLFTTRTTRNSKPQSIEHCNGGAALCSCLKTSMWWLTMIPGPTLPTASV